MKSLLILLLATNALALEHEEIVKELKKPKANKEVMSRHKNAVTISIDDLIPKDKQKELEKQKVEPSPTPHSSLFDRVSNVYMNKAHAFSQPKPTPTPLPTFVSLKHRDTHVVNQWNGTCTAHASVAAIENLLNKSINLSERHHWEAYKQYSSYASVESAQKTPIANEVYWPHFSTAPMNTSIKPQAKLTKVTYVGYDTQKLQEHLATGRAAIVAMTVPKDLFACLPVVREASDVDATAGHAMAVVGYGLDNSLQSKGYFIVKNSWGPNCHDKGYAAIPYNQCLKPGAYCAFWLFEKAEVIN